MKIRDVKSITILFAVALAFFASLSIANSQCHSAIAVQLFTGDPISLGGFKIFVNDRLLDHTNGYGAAAIPIDSKGYIAITTSKEVNGVLYSGSHSVQIHCGEDLSVEIPVSAQGDSGRDDGPGNNDRPGRNDGPVSDDWPWQ